MFIQSTKQGGKMNFEQAKIDNLKIKDVNIVDISFFYGDDGAIYSNNFIINESTSDADILRYLNDCKSKRRDNDNKEIKNYFIVKEELLNEYRIK